MILESLIPALIPMLSDGVRGIINKFTGGVGAKPANVEEFVTLMDAETKRLEALAKIDTAVGTSQWVSNVRAMQRPTVSLLIIGAYVGSFMVTDNVEIINQLGTYAQMVTFYLFGDRTYMYMKKK